MANPLDVLIRLRADSGNTKSELKSAADGVKAVDKSVASLGGNKGFAQAEASAKKYWDSVDKAKGSTENLVRSLESVRNVGAGIAVAGGIGLAIAESMVAAAVEADHLNAKMQALLSGAGVSGASDEIKKLSNEIAGLTNGDDDQIATAISQAIATGRTRGLVEYGIVIDEAGKKAIKAASDISELAGKQETVNQVMQAGARAVGELRANTDDAVEAVGEFNVRWGNLQEEIGMGAANAKAAILGGILGPILDIIEASPELKETAGYFAYIGGVAGSSIGGLVGFASQVAIIGMSLKTMGVTGAAAFGMMGNAAAIAAAKIRAVTLAMAKNPVVMGILVGTAAYELGRNKETTKSTYDILTGGGGEEAANDAKIKELEAKQAAVPAYTEKVAGAMQLPGGEMTDADEPTEKETKSAKKEATEAKREQAKVVREQAKAEKATASALKKALALKEKESQRAENYAADVEKAHADEAFETEIARLESLKQKKGDNSRIERQIEELKAKRLHQEAQIEAAAVADTDPAKANSIIAIAAAKAKGIRDRAAFLKGGLDPYAKFRNGTAMGGAGGAIPSLAMASSAGGGPFDPTAGRVSPWASAGAMATVNTIGMPGPVIGATPYTGASVGDAIKARTVKAQGSSYRNGMKRMLKIVIPDIDLGDDEMERSMQRYGY